jgi:hypothetical protein
LSAAKPEAELLRSTPLQDFASLNPGFGAERKMDD